MEKPEWWMELNERFVFVVVKFSNVMWKWKLLQNIGCHSSVTHKTECKEVCELYILVQVDKSNININVYLIFNVCNKVRMFIEYHVIKRKNSRKINSGVASLIVYHIKMKLHHHYLVTKRSIFYQRKKERTQHLTNKQSRSDTKVIRKGNGNVLQWNATERKQAKYQGGGRFNLVTLFILCLL